MKLNHFKFRAGFHFNFVTWITRLLCKFTFKNNEVENSFTPFEMKGYPIFLYFQLKVRSISNAFKTKTIWKNTALFIIYSRWIDALLAP